MNSQRFDWARFHPEGYEVSSRGDQRFSPLFARMPDGRSIEAHYQCDVKGFLPGSSEWRQFKGRHPTDKSFVDLWEGFLGLWRAWAADHPGEMKDLARIVASSGGVLTDRFASTPVNQARALCILLNEMQT